VTIAQRQQVCLPFDPEDPADVGCTAPHLTEWAPQNWPVADDWRPVLHRFLSSEAGQALGRFMRERLDKGAMIYPPHPFRALALTPLAQVRVVILGQDPYHGPGQAEGLAFSVAPGVRLPPSLRNIFKEVARDARRGDGRLPASGDGSLVRWAEQGVLLLNTCLTVEAGQAGSHSQRGWEALTDEIVVAASASRDPVVFMLWGSQAQAKARLITGADPARDRHLVLSANHPSPLSAMRGPRPFIGCGHFGLANAFLLQHGRSPINW
jgi:uracil-DNA glycosylase